MSRRPRILLIGYHGVGNFGDDLFLRIACEQLVARLGSIELTVSTDSAQQCPAVAGCHIAAAYPGSARLKKLDWLLLLGAALRSDAVLFCGGSIFAGQHQAGFRYLLILLRLFDRVQARNKPVFGIGLSFGPFTTSKARANTERAIQYFDRLIVRDETSYGIAAASATGTVVCTADIALALQPELSTVRWTRHQKSEVSRIGIFVGPGLEAGGTTQIEALVDAMLGAASNRNHSVEPTIFVTCMDGMSSDSALAAEAARLFTTRGYSVPVHVYNPQKALNFLESMLHMDGIVTSRLHPAIVGMAVGIPVLQIDSGQPKLRDVFATAVFEPLSFVKPDDIRVGHFESLFVALEPGTREANAAGTNGQRAINAHHKVTAAMAEAFDVLVTEIPMRHKGG
jgi:polysaccharide pyruvyl transferase WcaK-like protein